MADLNLPPPVQPVVETVAPGPMPGAVVVDSTSPAPLVVVDDNEDAVMQRVSNALDKLGIDPGIVKAHIVAQLEAAAAAYENAKVGQDKSFLQAQGYRLLAAFHAIVG
jgi:hypothetical protein